MTVLPLNLHISPALSSNPRLTGLDHARGQHSSPRSDIIIGSEQITEPLFGLVLEIDCGLNIVELILHIRRVLCHIY